MALILCPECSRAVSDKALACPGCGYPISFSPEPAKQQKERKTAPAKQKRRKLPNGYGSIKKLSGNRSRPYAAYPPAAAVSGDGLHSTLDRKSVV